MSLGDPSMWARNPMSWRAEHAAMYTDATIAHAMMGDQGQPLVPNLNPANNDRVNGWRNMSQLMKVEEGKEPNFIIIKGCAPNLQRTIPEMICDEKDQKIWTQLWKITLSMLVVMVYLTSRFLSVLRRLKRKIR